MVIIYPETSYMTQHNITIPKKIYCSLLFLGLSVFFHTFVCYRTSKIVYVITDRLGSVIFLILFLCFFAPTFSKEHFICHILPFLITLYQLCFTIDNSIAMFQTAPFPLAEKSAKTIFSIFRKLHCWLNNEIQIESCRQCSCDLFGSKEREAFWYDLFA